MEPSADIIVAAREQGELDIQAELDLGSEGSGNSELGSARARTKIRFELGSSLGLRKNILARYILEPILNPMSDVYFVDWVKFYLVGGILPRVHLAMWLSVIPILRRILYTYF